jgi:hypothetical protein
MPGDMVLEVNATMTNMDPGDGNFGERLTNQWRCKSTCSRPAGCPSSQGNDPSRSVQLWPLIDGNDFLTNRLADILTQRAVKTIVFQLFEDVCAPSGTTGNRKNRSEEIRRNT